MFLFESVNSVCSPILRHVKKHITIEYPTLFMSVSNTYDFSVLSRTLQDVIFEGISINSFSGFTRLVKFFSSSECIVTKNQGLR